MTACAAADQTPRPYAPWRDLQKTSRPDRACASVESAVTRAEDGGGGIAVCALDFSRRVCTPRSAPDPDVIEASVGAAPRDEESAAVRRRVKKPPNTAPPLPLTEYFVAPPSVACSRPTAAPVDTGTGVGDSAALPVEVVVPPVLVTQPASGEVFAGPPTNEGDGEDGPPGFASGAVSNQPLSIARSGPRSSSIPRTKDDNLLWVPAYAHPELAPEEFADWLRAQGTSDYQESEEPTGLNADLAFANETNEAALPRRRSIVRRKSALRHFANLEDEDDLAELFPSSNAQGPTDADGTTAVGMDVEVAGAAVALKHKLSIKLSAIADYNRADGTTDQSSGKAEFAMPLGLRRSSRGRLRRESLQQRGRPGGSSGSVFLTPPVDSQPPDHTTTTYTSAGPPRAQGILPSVGPYSERYARLAGDEVGRSASGEDLRVSERACSEDEALAPWRMAAMDKAATSVQRGGILTEIVIGADGEVIVLGSSGGKRHRALSSDSALCGVGVVNSPSGLKPTEEACEEEFGTKAAARRDAVVSCAACDPAADKPPGLLQVSSSSAAAGPSEPVAPSGTVRFPGECTASLQQSSGNSLGSQAKQLLQTSAKKQVLSLARQCTIHKLSSVFSLLFRDQSEKRLAQNKKSASCSKPQRSTSLRSASLPPTAPRTPNGAAAGPTFARNPVANASPQPPKALPGSARSVPGSNAWKEKPRKKAKSLSSFFSARAAKSSKSIGADKRNRAWFSSAPLPPETCSPAPEAPPRQPQNQPPAGELLSQDAAAAAERTFVGEQTVTYANRYPVHLERAIYRLSHAKLANPRRPLVHQVLISNMMFWYLALVARQQQLTQQQRNLFCQQEHCQKQQQHCDLKADHEDGSVDDECSTYGDESELEERRRCMKARKKAEKKLAKKIAKETRKKDVSV